MAQNPDLPEAWYRGNAVDVYFDSLAEIYGEGGYYLKRRLAVLRELEPRLRGVGSLLDLGCGNGLFLKGFADRMQPGLLLGVDLSPKMLHEARKRVGSLVALVRANALHLPLRSACVERVFCSHVLQLMPDLEQAVSEVKRVLCPGGQLIATFGLSHIREQLSQLVGPGAYQALEAAVFGRRMEREETQGEQRYRTVFDRLGLRPEILQVPFKAVWRDIDEWFRMRWLTVATPEEQREAERLLEELGRQAPADIEMTFIEPIIIGYG